MNTFDYVIVGGGTAGCILANRLTASGKYSVLVLEAGGEPSGFWIPIPAGFSKLLVDKRYNWRFKTQAEAGTCGREISVPRGKGLGGSTLINGMIYVRGQPGDYDAWEAAGARHWNFATLKPSARNSSVFAGTVMISPLVWLPAALAIAGLKCARTYEPVLIWSSLLFTSTSVFNVRVTGSIESALRAIVPLNTLPGYSSSVRSTDAPLRAAAESASGTLT